MASLSLSSLFLCFQTENTREPGWKTYKLGDKPCAALEGELMYFGLVLVL